MCCGALCCSVEVNNKQVQIINCICRSACPLSAIWHLGCLAEKRISVPTNNRAWAKNVQAPALNHTELGANARMGVCLATNHFGAQERPRPSWLAVRQYRHLHG